MADLKLKKTDLRSKFGFVNKDEIQNRIDEGKLDVYDLVFCKDTHEQFLIDGELNLFEVRSKIKVFNSKEQAIKELNDAPDTYVGQLIGILNSDGIYNGYIVNKDTKFYPTPLSPEIENINYDKLQNIPVINVKSDVPVVLTELKDAFYRIVGRIVTPTGGEINATNGNFVIISTNDDIKTIKRISEDNIFDYYIDKDGNVKSNKYATESYIKEQGFATTDYVDNAITALDCVSHEELEDYVKKTCTLLVDHIIDDKLAERIISEEEIEDLFDQDYGVSDEDIKKLWGADVGVSDKDIKKLWFKED